ncbi:2-hydroxyhepta-2,4-diene-1,7-dioate isomerase [Sulfolobus acidocaldarius SUSAZ]|nr:2-hydroxyhepta-2,4-diene-1,7-dioate isomerase [Sulfolobus acidocaldarius SUSAZ]
MKLAFFEYQGKVRLGEVIGNNIIEMESVNKEPKGGSYDIRSVKILPVQTTSIFCVLVNSYKMLGASSKQEGKEMLGTPKFFIKLPSIAVGNGDVVYAPKSGIRPEVEIGIIVKEKLRNINSEKIDDYILGYTVFNDVTAPGEASKDWYYARRRDPNDGVVKRMIIRGAHFRNKNRDTFAVLGSIITTPDEVKLDRLRMTSVYNNKVIQDSTTEEFIFSPEEIIKELSTILTIPQLSVITTGTVGYSGAEDTSEYKLEAKNTTMEVHVERIGSLVNPVKVI